MEGVIAGNEVVPVKDAKVVVSFSVAGAKSEQARFSLGQKADHKGHKH